MDSNEIRQMVEERYATLGSQDPFDFLGLSDDAGEDDIKRAYFDLAKVLHPDRVARAGVTDIPDKTAAVFKELTTAYNTLSNARTRADAVRKRREGAGPTEAEKARESAEERRIFTHRGDLMLKRRAYDEAESFFRRALQLNDEDPDVLVRLGCALFYNTAKSESKRHEEARRLWERAEKIADNPARAKYYLALYWKAKNDPGKMEKLLNAAIKKEPNFVEARRELRLLEMRKGRTVAKKGWFANLWNELTRKR